ncbi:MAG: hypothetical protein ACI9C4_000822 [Paraglaciecola sp.]|jgi:hypothetical protein
MVFPIIIVLIVSLIVIAIIVNAVQQHLYKVEGEKRAEVTKQKAVVNTTEDILLATEHIPVSQRLQFILQQRIVNALKIMAQVNPTMLDIHNRVQNAVTKLDTFTVETDAPSQDTFLLPSDDKQVIQFIKAIKRMRSILRSEYSKGRVENNAFTFEDKYLERLQLRANVETLMRRGEAAINGKQMGSARQCIEKAIAALDTQSKPDEYILARKQQLAEQLSVIQNSLKSANTEDVIKRKASERNELDELFAEKKKW